MKLVVMDINRDLVKDIANGNQEAFCKLFETFKNKVYSYSYHFTHSPNGQ